MTTEAATGLVCWADAHPEVRMVVAHTLPELTASIRVLEKNGFFRHGTLRRKALFVSSWIYWLNRLMPINAGAEPPRPAAANAWHVPDQCA